MPLLTNGMPRTPSLFPDAPGYGSAYTKGDAARARWFAGVQEKKNARAAADRSARSQAARVAPPSIPPMRPVGPISGQTGYGGVAQLGINRAAHARNVAGNTPGMGGYAGTASVATRNSALANSIRNQQRPQRQAKIQAARAQSALNKSQQAVPVQLGPARRKPIQAPAPSPRHMSGKTKAGLAIGGAAAIGVLMNRSGSPTSSGRQSTYRY